MRALVLSGGAARGAFEAGVASALLEEEDFDVVCGTSVGALNGAVVALGRPDLLRELWGSIGERHVLRPAPALEKAQRVLDDGKAALKGPLADRPAALGRLAHDLFDLPSPKSLFGIRGLLTPDPVADLLRPHLALSKLVRSFIIAVTNLSKGTSEAFYAFDDAHREREAPFVASEPGSQALSDDNMFDAVRAAAALPAAYAPVPIRNAQGETHEYADGAVANNTPLRQAIDAGATDVTLVFLQHSALRYRDFRLNSLAQIGFVAHDIMQERMLELDLKLARSINEAVRRGAGDPGKRFIELRTIGPSVPLRLGALSFSDQASIDRVFAQGVAEGQAALHVTKTRNVKK